MSERIDVVLYFRGNGVQKSITTDRVQLQKFESGFRNCRGEGPLVSRDPVFKFTFTSGTGHGNYTTTEVGVVDLREVAYYDYRRTEKKED